MYDTSYLSERFLLNVPAKIHLLEACLYSAKRKRKEVLVSEQLHVGACVKLQPLHANVSFRYMPPIYEN